MEVVVGSGGLLQGSSHLFRLSEDKDDEDESDTICNSAHKNFVHCRAVGFFLFYGSENGSKDLLHDVQFFSNRATIYFYVKKNKKYTMQITFIHFRHKLLQYNTNNVYFNFHTISSPIKHANYKAKVEKYIIIWS